MDAAERFTDRVDDYVRYRPAYPRALIDWLQDEMGLAPGALVADIGAGTGISSELFLSAGHRVIAVEPNAAMRAAAESRLGGLTGYASAGGRAEATGLDDASVDLVAAAQAFHWFDKDAARREWRRILRPGGLAAVFWNRRRLDGEPFFEGYERLIAKYCADYPAIAERYADDDVMRAWFGTGLRGMARSEHRQRLDFEALRGRMLSVSYIPKQGEPGYAPLFDEMRTLFERHARDGRVDIVYDARIYAGNLA